jgi:hypothetical protein
MANLTRDLLARAIYELHPYVAPQEYLGVMGTDGSGILQLVGGGPYTWAQAVEADAMFAGVSFYRPLTARAYRAADAVLCALRAEAALASFAHPAQQQVLPAGR